MADFYIVSVIPSHPRIWMENLSYFSRERPKIGSICTVAISRKTYPALVVKVTRADEQKLTTKRVPYKLVKLGAGHPIIETGTYLINALRRYSEYYLMDMAQILDLVLPRLDKIRLISKMLADSNSTQEVVNTTNGSRLIAGGTGLSRITSYISTMSKLTGQYSLICVPSAERAKGLYTELGRQNFNVDVYNTCASSGKILPNMLFNPKKHTLVIATPKLACLLIKRAVGLAILAAGEAGYNSVRRTEYDARPFLLECAKQLNVPTYLLDVLPPLNLVSDPNNIVRAGNKTIWTNTTKKKTDVVQIVGIDYKSESNKTLIPLAGEIKDLLLDNRHSLLLLTSSSGLSKMSVCVQCGSTHSCPTCSLPLSLVERVGSREYYCPSCREVSSAEVTCRTCGSWDIRSYGAGTKSLLQSVNILAPERKVLVIGGGGESYHKMTDRLYNALEKNKLVIAPTSIIPYLQIDIPRCALVYIDSLFYIPLYNTREVFVRRFLHLRSLITHRLTIQTNLMDPLIKETLITGELPPFMQAELEVRRKYSYPPYGVLIHLEGKSRKGANLTFAKKALADYNPMVATNISEVATGIYIKLKPTQWPNQQLSQKLVSLQSEYRIVISPGIL